MQKVIRVFVEKKAGFDIEARQLLADLRDNLGLNSIKDLRLLNRYDVEGVTPDEFERACGIVFSEPNVDNVYYENFNPGDGWKMFAMEYLPGQYDQRADSCAVHTARHKGVQGRLGKVCLYGNVVTRNLRG